MLKRSHCLSGWPITIKNLVNIVTFSNLRCSILSEVLGKIIAFIVFLGISIGATLEIITDRSQEGAQFCKGFGGIGGIGCNI